ncbi:SGNH/GDSL hydrolase family protein [Glutamicibacter halophytocola]|uniref:SGNH/GDSL hydrolase family protein n=1 Tax=Glutamicibacter halophytocola TaxID=1933880 RepID=A0AA95BVJ9_9MICC|nr:SGNH/GDSL hydrolase family protein [Glutamicibacter halophytocola]UUX60418.1 SGNH/GDSL hydrolase family protein [Glutamicibacter halophytocola]
MSLRQKTAFVLVLFVVLAVALVPAIQGFVSANSHAVDATPSASPTHPSGANNFDRVLFAGDSISVGRDARLLPESFRAITSRRLKANGTQSITTVAKSGAKLNYIAHSKTMPADLDLAIIELGTNDAGGNTPIESFRKEYQNYLKRIRTHSPSVGFVCLGVWYRPEAKIAQDLDAVIKETCGQNSGIFIPLSDLYVHTQNRGPRGTKTWKGKSDLFHPNTQGHLAIAKKIIKELSLPAS